MTAPTEPKVPARRAVGAGGHSALQRLVAVPAEEFADSYWAREPLLSAAEHLPHDHGDLFSAAAVDELVSLRGLRAPFLRVAKDGSTLDDSAFTSGGGVGAAIADQASDDKLLRLFAGGATIVLQGLHRTWPPLLDFAQQLAAELGHPVQVNAYVTPPQNTGFSDHYDVHDVFVLQVEGEKRWRVRRPVHPLPLRDEPWDQRRREVEQAAIRPPLLEVTMRPGDCLYLPRGFLHSATALGGVSTHVTIGVHPWTRHHLAGDLVAETLSEASRDPAVRDSLRLGTDVTDAQAIAPDLEQVRAALHRALDTIDAEVMASRLAGRLRAAQRPAPIGPLGQLRSASQLAGIPTLSLRRHLAAQLTTTSEGYAVLVSRAGRLRLEPEDLEAVRRFLASGEATAADLGVDLSRRLLLGGVAVVPETGQAEEPASLDRAEDGRAEDVAAEDQ